MTGILSAGLEIFAAIIMAVILCACLSDYGTFSKRDRYIVLMVGFAIIMLLTDVPTYFIGKGPEHRFLTDVLSFLSYSACELETVLFTFYFAEYLSRSITIPHRILKLARLLGLLGMVLWIVLCAAGLSTGIDESGNYVFTGLYLLTAIPPLLIVLINVGYTLYNASKIPNRLIVLTAVYNLVPMTMVPLIHRLNTMPVYVAAMLMVFLLYLMMHQDENLRNIEQSREIMKQRAELANSRARIMISQIQPHFLYNTLNAIYYLIEKNPPMAQKAVSDFSEYLRMNIDTLSSAQPVEFAKELKHIETYLWIEKLRFDDELNIVYDIEYKDFFVPALSIQPFVENAVKHGLCKKDGGGTLWLKTRKLEKGCVIEVRDDGAGFDPKLVRQDDGREHIGVSNSRQRIENLLGGTITVESSVGEGTTVTIFIPEESNDIEKIPGRVIVREENIK